MFAFRCFSLAFVAEMVSHGPWSLPHDLSQPAHPPQRLDPRARSLSRYRQQATALGLCRPAHASKGSPEKSKKQAEQHLGRECSCCGGLARGVIPALPVRGASASPLGMAALSRRRPQWETGGNALFSCRRRLHGVYPGAFPTLLVIRSLVATFPKMSSLPLGSTSVQ